MSETPNNPEFINRSPATVDTNLLQQLEMVKLFLKNEGFNDEFRLTSSDADELTTEALIDKAVSLFVNSFRAELSEGGWE